MKSPYSNIKQNTKGRGDYIFELKYDIPIWIDNRGKDINTLKVVIDEFGNITTAYPIK